MTLKCIDQKMPANDLIIVLQSDLKVYIGRRFVNAPITKS